MTTERQPLLHFKLRHYRLERYAPAFHDNDIDREVLAEQMAEDLIGLGADSIGHRRKLLAVISALRKGVGSSENAPARRIDRLTAPA